MGLDDILMPPPPEVRIPRIDIEAFVAEIEFRFQMEALGLDPRPLWERAPYSSACHCRCP